MECDTMTEESIKQLINELRLVQFDSVYVNRQKLRKLESIIPNIPAENRAYYEDEYKRLFALSQLPPDLETKFAAFVKLHVEGKGR